MRANKNIIYQKINMFLQRKDKYRNKIKLQIATFPLLQGDQGLVLPKDDMSHAFYRIIKEEFPLSNQQLSTRLHVVF